MVKRVRSKSRPLTHSKDYIFHYKNSHHTHPSMSTNVLVLAVSWNNSRIQSQLFHVHCKAEEIVVALGHRFCCCLIVRDVRNYEKGKESTFLPCFTPDVDSMAAVSLISTRQGQKERVFTEQGRRLCPGTQSSPTTHIKITHT